MHQIMQFVLYLSHTWHSQPQFLASSALSQDLSIRSEVVHFGVQICVKD